LFKSTAIDVGRNLLPRFQWLAQWESLFWIDSWLPASTGTSVAGILRQYRKELFVPATQEIEEGKAIVDLRLRGLDPIAHADIREKVFTVRGRPICQLQCRLERVALVGVRLVIPISVIVGQIFAKITICVREHVFDPRQLLSWRHVR